MLASRLQKEAPSARDLLWLVLKSFNQRGYHFRRREVYRSFHLDFVEHDIRLAIVLKDEAESQLSPDIARDHVLAAEGYAVLRFHEADIAGDLGNVSETIAQVLEDNPPESENGW